MSVGPFRPPSNRCPECGEIATQFAAGCAYCGADLEKLRRPPRVTLGQRIYGMWVDSAERRRALRRRVRR